MTSFALDHLTPFGRLAVTLDGDFAALQRISGQLERLDIDSESGLDRALKLLAEFAQHGQSISEGIQKFSLTLQEAREHSELAAKSVAERAEMIQQRKQKQIEIKGKLAQVEERIKAANQSLSSFKKEGNSPFSDDEKRRIAAQLERLSGELAGFTADAQAVKEEARHSKFKSIEHDAQSMIETLQSSRRRIEKAISSK